MIDYETPRYKTSEVARAAGLGASALRNYFARGHFRVLGLDRAEADKDGLPNLFSLRDTLLIAVAADLIAAGVPAGRAYWAAVKFAHTGNAGNSINRLPARVFPQGLTLLIYRPKSDNTAIINSGNNLDLSKALAPVSSDQRDPAIIVDLGTIHAFVLSALNA